VFVCVRERKREGRNSDTDQWMRVGGDLTSSFWSLQLVFANEKEKKSLAGQTGRPVKWNSTAN